MSYNPSLAKFKRELADRTATAKYNAHQLLLAKAAELAENIREAAPKQSGALAGSVRVVDVSQQSRFSARYSVLVIAGGQATTRDGFDYAIATEFGTVKENPEPFFYNTARRYLSPATALFGETLKETIINNEKVSEARKFNQRLGSIGFVRRSSVA